MICCIWYPSGGFGHYVNGVISLYAPGFARPGHGSIEFSALGNSHQLPLVAPKYIHDKDHYDFEFEPGLNYSVLIDNGIDNRSEKFKSLFPNASIIKITYNDLSWPVVAKTSIIKAIGDEMFSHLKPETDLWADADQPWAQREKFFLYLRDGEFRDKWQASKDCTNLDVMDIYDYPTLSQTLMSLLGPMPDFSDLHQEWKQANKDYFDVVFLAQDVLKCLRNNQDMDISHITDLWTQAVINYFIWLEYSYEIPVNDFANWFTNTRQIYELLSSTQRSSKQLQHSSRVECF